MQTKLSLLEMRQVTAFVANGSSLECGWSLAKGTIELLAEIHVMLVKNLQMESKMFKSKEEYRAYVEKYETVRVDFEEKMERACKMFQSHDRSHFAALQQFLLLYATHHQEATIA
ncbi:unnamed protein product, partial [Strongylus vulgaris]